MSDKLFYTLADAKRALENLIQEFGLDAQAIGKVRAKKYHPKSNVTLLSSIYIWPARCKPLPRKTP
jgi:hypothetical protein